MCPLKVDLLFVTFDPEVAEICSVILTHPIGGHNVATIIVATCLVKGYACPSVCPAFLVPARPSVRRRKSLSRASLYSGPELAACRPACNACRARPSVHLRKP